MGALVLPTEVGRDGWRDLRISLVLLAFVLYCMAAVAPTLVIAYSMAFRADDVFARHPPTLAFRAVADVLLTVGMGIAIRSVRNRDPGPSWRLLGWTGLTFAAGFAVLILGNAME